MPAAAAAAAADAGTDALANAQAMIAKASSIRASGVLASIAASMCTADADGKVPEGTMTKRYALLHPRPHHATATAMGPPTPLVSAQANPEIINFLSSSRCASTLEPLLRRCPLFATPGHYDFIECRSMGGETLSMGLCMAPHALCVSGSFGL